jgi:hypothetical protein
MADKTINIDGSGKDGAMTYWEPGEISRTGLVSALDKIGKVSLTPKGSTRGAALQDAFSAFIDRAKIKVRGRPIKFFPLSAEVTGFDARQINPGNEEVDPVFVASIVVDDNDQVQIAKYNPAILPQLDNHKAKVESVLQSVFDNRCNYFPTATVSACVARVIESLGGIRIRRAGGYYFVPRKGLDDFDDFSKEVANQSGPEIVAVKFPLVPTETSYAAVLKSVKTVAKERLAAIEAGLLELGTDRKMRSNGKESRLKECEDVLSMLKDYEEILGVSLSESKELVAKVETAVHAHAALEWAL